MTDLQSDPRSAGRSVIASRLLPALLVSIALAACAAPARRGDVVAVPEQFQDASARCDADGVAAIAPGAGWWTVFADPALDALVVAADRSNTSIEQAVARVAQARALVDGAQAARLPQVGVAAGLSRQGGPLVNAAGASGTLAQLGAAFSYEVDLIGRLSQTARAAELDLRSRLALQDSARLLVEADTASAYFAWRALDDEQALLRTMAASYRDTVSLVERRRRAGYASDQDVARLHAEAAATEAEALAIDRRRATLEHHIAFLTGAASAALPRETLAGLTALPLIPSGIPSTVLARRPDVAAAERAMDAARLRVGIAKTAWVPTFSLTASGGHASNDLGELLRSSARSWGIAGLIAATVFDGGRREAAVRGADADLALAAAGYREQVLVALRDVEDQLSSLRLLAAQADALRSAVDAAHRVTDRSESLYRNGLVAQLDLLDARRTELRDRRAALQVDAARRVATVALVRALGGGWAAPRPSDAPLAFASPVLSR